MIRANIKDNNQTYKGFILIRSNSDLIDYINERLRGLVKESATELVKRARARAKNEDVSHATDVITHLTEVITEMKPRGCIINQAILMGNLEHQWFGYIANNKIIAINPLNGVSHFTLTSTAEVEIISEQEKYTENDIKIYRWGNGAHWYAKIGYMDVIVDGEQKWNARWVAEAKAKEFLKTL